MILAMNSGNISGERGISQMIKAAERTNCSLACIGYYTNTQSEEEVIIYIGERGYDDVHII